MIGHKSLRITKRYTHLENLRDNQAQNLLAAMYEKTSTMRKETLRTQMAILPKIKKKGFQVLTRNPKRSNCGAGGNRTHDPDYTTLYSRV